MKFRFSELMRSIRASTWRGRLTAVSSFTVSRMPNPPETLSLRAQRLRHLRWRSISEARRSSDGLDNCSFPSTSHGVLSSTSCALASEICPSIGYARGSFDGKRFGKVEINDWLGSLARVAVTYNKQLQRTVMHKVPSHIGQRAAAELRR